MRGMVWKKQFTFFTKGPWLCNLFYSIQKVWAKATLLLQGTMLKRVGEEFQVKSSGTLELSTAVTPAKSASWIAEVVVKGPMRLLKTWKTWNERIRRFARRRCPSIACLCFLVFQFGPEGDTGWVPISFIDALQSWKSTLTTDWESLHIF